MLSPCSGCGKLTSEFWGDIPLCNKCYETGEFKEQGEQKNMAQQVITIAATSKFAPKVYKGMTSYQVLPKDSAEWCALYVNDPPQVGQQFTGEFKSNTSASNGKTYWSFYPFAQATQATDSSTAVTWCGPHTGDVFTFPSTPLRAKSLNSCWKLTVIQRPSPVIVEHWHSR